MRLLVWLKERLSRFGAQPNSTDDINTEPSQQVDAEAETASHVAQYSSDKPIHNRDEDRFKRWPFAKRIAEILASRRDPSSIVIGLYGVWGDGKTSVLAMMEEALLEETNVISVRFNPWLFKSQEQLLSGFFATLAEALGRSLPTVREELGNLLDRYGGLLSLASVGLAGGLVQVNAGNAVKELGKTMSNVELDELKVRIEKILASAKTRVVVLIDDIDRLDREEIHAVFKLVKLSAGFDYTSYVLAFDDEVVAASLGERYGEGSIESGRNFLEKIIQVPLHLPPVDQVSLRKVTFEGVDEALKVSGIKLTEEQVDVFVRYFVDGIELRLKTPRHAKLYANALLFGLPILRGEVHPVDQMLVEGIRIFYPKLYATIRDHREYFLPDYDGHHKDNDFLEQVKHSISDALSGLSDREKERVRSRLLANLFPRLKNIFGNTHYGPDWEKAWEKEKRVCSESYFARYFGYGVPFGDVPDHAITELLRIIETENEQEIKSALYVFKADNAIAKVIQKLRQQEDEIAPEVGRQLALAIARNSDVIPREKDMMMADMSLMQSSILISNMIKNLASEDERAQLAFEIIESAKTLPFAFKCLQWIRKSDDEAEEERVISSGNEDKLGQRLVSRIRNAAQVEAIYREYGPDTPALLWAWNRYGTEGEVSASLRERFEADSSEIDEFLNAYVGLSWGLESGIPHRSDFNRDYYEAVKKIIEPGYIMEKLHDRYGMELNTPQYHHKQGTPIALRIAHQFAHVHGVACDEGADITQAEDEDQ